MKQFVYSMFYFSFKSLAASAFCIFMLFVEAGVYAQTCPTFSKRNNGNNVNNVCSPDDPSNYGSFVYKTGDFIFSTTANDFTISKVYYNNTLLQNGSTGSSVVSGTTFFGAIKVNNSTSNMCFYGYSSSSGGLAPAGYYRFEITSGSSTISCTYAISSVNQSGLLSITPGTIGTDQTICSGGTPSRITSTEPATNYSSYKWQKSTTSSSSGFTDISPAVTTAYYDPGSLTQTTYFQRIAIDGSSNEVSSNVITINVSQIAGTISPMPGTTWSGATTTFSTSGTSGGTWSLTASPAGVASINSSSGLLTASSAGSGTVTYTVTSGGLTCSSTRNFTISGTSGSLPVTWETVSAQKQNGQSVLRWSTASEQNTKDFVVQHSLNATDWSSLSTIPAAGNSTTTRNYSYVHQNPLKGNNYNYYRILQRDIDDKFSYSKIVSIIFNEPGSDVQVYPNPVHDQLTVFLAESQWVRLVNAAGATVWKGQLPAGRNTIPVQGYSKGAYVLTAGKQSFRVLIQ